MLQITVPATDFFDERTQEFVSSKETVLNLEHSLVSISKWESRWKKPFLTRDRKTNEELIDYVRCMTINQNVDPTVYKAISQELLQQIVAYCEEDLTATTFRNDNTPPSREIITSEVIYYWMTTLNIPVEFQKWHLSRLLTLIKVCNAMNSPKKMSKLDILSQNAKLNAQRRKAMKTKG